MNNSRNAMAVMSAMAVLGSLLSTGCMKKTDTVHRPVFEERSLDACLVLSIDLSSSFAADIGERAY
ncbi:MAG: hypothetical protein ABJG45_12180, partial [Rhodopirellula bahusiensis]